MFFITATLLGIALAADAFAISVSLGLKRRVLHISDYLLVGILFGGFQGLMPCIGFYLGSLFSSSLFRIGNIITFAILLFLGIKTFFFSDSNDPLVFDAGKIKSTNIRSNHKALFNLNIGYIFFLAILTSIDALSIGVALALDHQPLFINCMFISIITFILSTLGILFGKKLGNKYQKIATKLSGIILAILAFKALLP